MAEFNRTTQTWCVGCMKPKEKTAFIQSLNPHHNIYLPLCRACLNSRFKQYQEELKSEGGALWCLCAEMGYPVIREYYDMAVSRKSGASNGSILFMAYHNTLKELGFVIEGFWQSDMMLDDFIERSISQEDVVKKEEEKEANLAKQKRVWGEFEPEDYDLLNELYEAYTKNLFSIDTPMELRYRDLCKAELRKRQADKSGDINEIAKAQDNIKKILELLKLDKFQSNTKTDVEKTLEYQIAMMEKYKPAELEDISAYEDYCGCHHLETQLMRPLRNLIAGTRDYPSITKE